MIIAIDGPSASGKSTTAKGVAKKLGITHLDTGAMYRAATFGLKKSNIQISDLDAVRIFLNEMDISFDVNNDIHLNGENISVEIRTRDISSSVSAVSALPIVRDKMVMIQRQIGKENDCVLEGRDIGTVVFPNADFKFFLIADVTVRAKRRLKELSSFGDETSIDELIKDIEKRDLIDSSRDHSPLIQADDAILIDTSHITIDEQIKIIVNQINQKQKETS